MKVKQGLTDTIFFDTDCISAFLWVNNQSIVEQLYESRIVFPREVYEELNNPRISHLKRRIDNMISRGVARIMDMDIASEEYELFRELTHPSAKGQKWIGKGEASAISLAKAYGGIVASNNLRDVLEYINEFHLEHITTGDILFDAYNSGIISEEDGNDIWQRMLDKRRMLGYCSFSEFLEKKGYK